MNTMRTFRVIVSGNEYEVAIEEITKGDATKSTASVAPVSAPKKAAPSQGSAPTPAGGGEGSITAAMPGTIISVEISVGDNVKRGDTLMILEAMKMENEIQSPVDGTVSSVEVEKGASVNAGTLLAVID